MNFCVKCGMNCMESMDGLCIVCWTKSHKMTFLPQYIEIKKCKICGEFDLNGKKLRLNDVDSAIRSTIIGTIRADKDINIVSTSVVIHCQDVYTYSIRVDSVCDIMGYKLHDYKFTTVRIKNSVCRICSKQLGNYYESILQIRSGKSNSYSLETIDEVLSIVKRYVSKRASNNIFITKIVSVVNGVDIYLSSISLGRSLTKELSSIYCVEVKKSPKLVRQSHDGQDIYRLTYLVRFPDYNIGDVVLFHGLYCKLLQVSNNGGRVLNLINFKEMSFSRTDIGDIKLYKKASEFKNAIVISRSIHEIQVLNPDTYSTVDLFYPEGMQISDTVRTISTDDAFYMVP